MNERDLDQMLDAIHLERMAYPGADAVTHGLSAPIEQIPQRHFVLPPLAGRFQTMFSATRFVVAGVIVALFGSALAAGFLPPQSSDVSNPAATA